MKRLSGRFGVRRLIAVAGAGALLSAGLGVAAASAADRTVGGTRATSVSGADFYDVPPRVDVIPARTGTYYGQKMIKGDIYALPGLGGASAVAVDSAGNGKPPA